MSKVVNLRTKRKQRARTEKQGRALSGDSAAAAKLVAAKLVTLSEKRLDGHRISKLPQDE